MKVAPPPSWTETPPPGEGPTGEGPAAGRGPGRSGGGGRRLALAAALAALFVALAVVIPARRERRLGQARREAAANLERIGHELERYWVDGHVSYTDGGGRCPGTASYSAHGESWIPDLRLRVEGDRYRYTVQAADPDGDGLCERYSLRADGLAGPAQGDEPLLVLYPETVLGPWPPAAAE